MMPYNQPPTVTDPGFDARMKYLETLGDLMTQVSMASSFGHHEGRYRALHALVDANPYLTKEELKEIDEALGKAKKLLGVVNGSTVKDNAINAYRLSKTKELEAELSKAQRLVFQAMAKHEMLLPKKTGSDDEMDDDELAEEMGL